MGAYEAIDKLCAVTTMLSDLAREQSAIIAQADIPLQCAFLIFHVFY